MLGTVGQYFSLAFFGNRNQYFSLSLLRTDSKITLCHCVIQKKRCAIVIAWYSIAVFLPSIFWYRNKYFSLFLLYKESKTCHSHCFGTERKYFSFPKEHFSLCCSTRNFPDTEGKICIWHRLVQNARRLIVTALYR